MFYSIGRSAPNNGADRKSTDVDESVTSATRWRRQLVKLLSFYTTDARIHAVIPLAFFTGLFDAFVARDFVIVSGIHSG
jgi:hypothetical protein